MRAPLMRARMLAGLAACCLLPSATNVAIAASAAVAPQPAAWPHTIEGKDGSVTVYPPQVIDWPGRTRLDARVVVAVRPNGATAPILGTIELKAATTTDLATRIVTVSDMVLTASRFPSLDTARATGLESRLQAALSAMPPQPVPLDMVLLSLQQSPDASPVAVSNDPPVIYASATPASLVVFDGDPVMVPAPGGALTHAVNTNWDVFQSVATQRWYLLNDGAWFSAAAFRGPWTPEANLPTGFAALAAVPQFTALRGHVPGRALAANAAPAIIVSTVPAEIIATEGPPAWSPVPGTALQVATNTPSALFRDSGGRLYYLTSGRWFSAASLAGPWLYATDSLPADFAMIPPDGKLAPLLTAVPGTQQASEAVIQAQIPVQAMLSRKTTTITVSYAGAPRFVPIPGTQAAYAANTATPVFQVGATYYACWRGAWFTAAAATGPFVLATSVPDTIYAIPPTSPLYPVTYVHVGASTPTTVSDSYTAGYALGFISADVLVYGTGYDYPPVIVPGPVPAYFPYPHSYVGHAAYDPYTGVWARGGTYYNPATGGWAHGGTVYGPNGGAGAFAAYNPATGRYSQGSASWGPNGGNAQASFVNPRTGVSGSTSQHGNLYARWGSSVVSGPNATVHTASARTANGAAGAVRSSTGAAAAGVHGANGNNAGIARGPNGNVYAGADGNVYRKDSSGWSKWNDGSWSSVQRPNQGGAAGTGQRSAGTSQTNFRQLDTDNQARLQGWNSGGGRSWGGGGGGGGRFRR